MKMNEIRQLSEMIGQTEKNVAAAVELIDAGNTIPFIARYRKEKTGAMDDQTLRLLFEKLTYLRSLSARKEEIKRLIDEQGKWTPTLETQLQNAKTLAEAEDIYLPYRPKRKTRASVARERGLEKLAEILAAQTDKRPLEEIAAGFVGGEVADAAGAIAGAMDILAEDIAENAGYRGAIRRLTWQNGLVQTAAASEEDTVYRSYYEFTQSVSKMKAHQVLAIRRGEKEKKLKFSLSVDQKIMTTYLYDRIKKPNGSFDHPLRDCIEDSYKRLLAPAIEREITAQLFENAEQQAMLVFKENLKQLLLQPPLKGKTVLGFDPGYRTGCKICVVDPVGKVLAVDVIYPTPPKKDIVGAERKIRALIEKYHVSALAVGNGTASKESEIFVAEAIKGTGAGYMMVSEAGASVYSASPLAAAEFPNYDVSLRSAVSIARRLQDPLSELVKIDPKSIGVGQYQHDMKQKNLSQALDGVVEECVNTVGADLNTASVPLLEKIAGISSAIAKNIVQYREQNGMFKNRAELKKVSKLGAKAYEQCAGFLRVKESKQPLDNTSVHPESYAAAEALLKRFGMRDSEIGTPRMKHLAEQAESVGYEALSKELNIGVPTLRDIVSELLKPGRDPREDLPKPQLRSDVMDMKDIRPGMGFTGTVRNITDFGAFVDIGVHQDGLVHISQLSDRYVKHPLDVVHVGDVVRVTVLSVEPEKNRISLTMKEQNH